MDIVRPINAKRTSPRSWLLAVFMLFVVVVLLWLPFGFKTTGLIEEWDVMVVLKNGYRLFYIDANSPFAAQRIRPLLELPQALAYKISPNSFFGVNVAAFFIVFFQGAAFYGIIKGLLPRRSSLALVAALLFIIYPGDNAQFATRMLPLRAGVLFYLLALHFIIRYWCHSRRVFLIMTWLCLAVSLLLYEVSFPLVVLTPLVLVLLGGATWQRLIRVSLLWLIVPIVLGIRIVLILIRPDAIYEITALGPDAVRSLLSAQGVISIFQALQHAYAYQIVTGWQDAWTALTSSSLFTVLSIVVALLTGLACWWLLKKEQLSVQAQLKVRYNLILIAVGVIVIAVGFSPYILSSSHRTETNRVFLYSMIGSTLAAVLLSFLISRLLPFKNVLFSAGVGVLVGLAMVHALNQQQRFVAYSLAQQEVLAQALEQAPHISRVAALIVFDATNQMQSDWFFGDNRVSQFRYIYRNMMLNAQICFEHLSPPLVLTDCVFSQDGLHITQNREGAPPVNMIIPYDRLILFKYSENADTGKANFDLLQTIPKEYFDEQVTAYNPESLVDKKTATSPEVEQLFECWPLEPCLPSR